LPWRPSANPAPRYGSTLDQQTLQYLGAINPENSVFKPTNFNGFHAAANNCRSNSNGGAATPAEQIVNSAKVTETFSISWAIKITVTGRSRA
jgi:hypothetical protein